MIAGVCKSCRHWRVGDAMTVGLCKRYPPQILLMPKPNPAGQRELGLAQVHPNTSPDDGCGEWLSSVG